MGKPFVFKPISPNYVTPLSGIIIPEKEIEEYTQAINQSKKELDKIFMLAKEKLDMENLQIFEAQVAFLNDDILHKKVIDRIRREKKPSYNIFNEELKSIEAKLLSSYDDYIKGRVADIEDIKNRVLRNMAKMKLVSKIDENSIVIAQNLTPADTILFSKRNLLGFATDLGGTNSHVAIIARSLGVPAVVGMTDISNHIQPDDYLIIDGYRGYVVRNPLQRTIQRYKRQLKKYSEYEKRLAELRKFPSKTRDGTKINLVVNLEFNKELDFILTHIGCGVGLYRTEHIFLEMEEFPSEEEQYSRYKMLADRLYPHQVTIRTFDVGGDKLLPETQKESNPFLGWRGIRICLDKPDIFLNQLKAILRASTRGNIKIMFPMISSLDEVRETKRLLNAAKSDLKKRKIRFDENIQAGIMVEVPSVVFMADDFAKEVDFFSIGTNDLVQYILAVDRDSSTVENYYQKFHPAVVHALKTIVRSAEKNKIGLSVCGEMAGDPLGSLLLIGLGVKELSVETTAFLRIKRLIRMLKFSDAKKIAEKALTMDNEAKIKELLSKSFEKIIKELE